MTSFDFSSDAVIFDWDGTLVDTTNLIIDSHNHVRGYMGLTLWSKDDTFSMGHKSTRELYPEIYGDRSDEAITVLYDFFKDNHLNYLQSYDGSELLVQELHQNQIPMAIVSNKRHEYLLREIEYLGWEHYFEYIIGAGVADRDKPAPDPLYMALDALNKPNTPIYIGDTQTDLECARAAGVPCVFMDTNQLSKDILTQYKPIAVINTIMDFKGLLLDSTTKVGEKKAC